MTTSRLQQTVKHYRAQLTTHEQQAEAALNAAHLHTLAAIKPQLDNLYREIAAAQQKGEKIPPSWLYEQRRLQSLKQTITGQIDHYAALAQMQTGQLQHTGVTLGLQAGQQQLQATVPTGVQWSFGVPSQAAIADMVGATQAGSPLATLFAGFGPEAADAAGKALITGLSLGQNPRAIAALVQQALDISRARALTICRTQMLDAYRSSNLATFQANSDVVDQWSWSCSFGKNTCVACLAMDGTLHSLDEDMESHVNCRCVMLPVTKSWSDILSPLGIDTSNLDDSSDDGSGDDMTGADWFANQSEDTQQQMMGPARYDLYSNGMSLMEMTGIKTDATWGNSVYVKPLKELAK